MCRVQREKMWYAGQHECILWSCQGQNGNPGLGDVSYIDSSGLGELVSSYTTAANQGAKVKLLNVQKKVNDLLQITKLYTVFDDFKDEAAAVMSFS